MTQAQRHEPEPWEYIVRNKPLHFVGIESMVRMEEELMAERWGPFMAEYEARSRRGLA